MRIDELTADLIRDEGLRLKPYKCSAGKLTIGVGRNIEDNGITRDEAMMLLENDIGICRIECEANFRWWRGLDDVRQDVLLNMCFNIGINRLLGFKNMLSAVERKDWDKAATEMMDSKWATQVGVRAERLKHMMQRGER